MTEFMPQVMLLGGALVLPLAPRATRSALLLVFPLVAFLLLLRLPSGTQAGLPFLEYELVIIRVDGLSLAFGYVFTLITFLGGLYSFHVKDTGQQVAALLYAGSGLGVVFAGDWLTLYIFWELMAISSVWLIWSARDAASIRAGMRYLLMHLFGGGALLAGILLHGEQTQSLSFNALEPGSAAYLILIGFAVNAAIPPLHTWLVDAYPEASVTGSVFLSAFTTKAAVYVLSRGFPGWEILQILGTVMAVYGVVFAFLENDIRRILAYHIVSQVGYMVAGVGLGTEMALNGATAHAFAHILYKGLLFMGAGAVLYATGQRKLTELGGLAGSLPWVLVFYMVGALSISGFPLLSGFVSKALVLHAAHLDHRSWMVLLLSVASVGTFLSVGLKLPYFTWFGSGRSLPNKTVPPGMYMAMGLASAINLAIGLAPELLYRVLPFAVEYRPYTAAHLLETIEILGFTGLVFWFLRDKLVGKATITLDFDWFYRRPAPILRQLLVVGPNDCFTFMEDLTLAVARQLSRLSMNPFFAFGSPFRSYDPDVYRSPLGTIVLVVLLCVVFLLGWRFLRFL